MKKFITSLILIAIITVASPSHAMENESSGFFTSLLSSIGEYIFSIKHTLLGSENQLAASMVAVENNQGKAIGIMGDHETDTLPDGPGVFKGELHVAIGENFETGKVDHFYFLYDKITNKIIELKGDLPYGLDKGSILKAKGNVKDGVLVAGANLSTDEDPIEVVSFGSVTSPVSELINVGVIVGNFNDRNIGCSVGDVRDVMFSDTNSVTSGFESMTNGEIGYVGDVYGPYTIDHSQSVSNINSWSVALKNAAEASGVNTSQYDTLIYVLPANASGYGGYAYYGGDANIYSCHNPEIYIHELGHTIYQGHAGQGANVYADNSDFMGGGYNGVIGAHSVHLGKNNWIPNGSILENPNAGQYTIGSSDKHPDNVIWPQVIKLSKADTNQYYYISYRTGDRYAVNMPDQYKNTVQVHLSSSETSWTGGNSIESNLLASLQDGQSFNDSVNGITVARTSSLFGEYAVIDLDVSFDCVTNSPSVNITPAEVGSSIGGTATYNVSVNNNNGQFCGSSNISLSSNGNSSGLTTSLSSNGINLASGATGNITLSAISDSSIIGDRHVVEVTATNDGKSSSDTAIYSIDGTAPSVPTNVSVNKKRKFSTISWNASSDNVGVFGYEVYRNGANIGSTDTTSYADRDRNRGGDYQVRAYDVAGNYSGLSDIATSGSTDDGGDDTGTIKCTPGAKKKRQC